MKIVIFKAILPLLVAALMTGCARQAPANDLTTSSFPVSGSAVVPEPKPVKPTSPDLGPRPETFTLQADTVAIGTVVEGSTRAGQTGSIYSYWVFNVEEYVVKPLPTNNVTIRILENDGIPVKGPHLQTGEHLLVFLQNKGDYFELVGGIGNPGKFTIKDDQIKYSFYGWSPWEPLDAAKSRIKAAADTWKGESLTPERREQLIGLAIADTSVKDFLVGKQYETGAVVPYLDVFTPGEITYLVALISPNARIRGSQLNVIVNVTKGRVDNLNLNVGGTLPEQDVQEAYRIAIADPAVVKQLANRRYDTFAISRDFWTENSGGKTTFHIFPKVELLVYPRGSETLDIFVDLEQKKVVKIFVESHLSQSPVESTDRDGDFLLTVKIPKTEYAVGEIVEVEMTLSYLGRSQVQLSSPGGQLFDILIKNQTNTIIYRWRDETYGIVTPAPTFPPPPLNEAEAPLLPIVAQNISSGWSYTGRLQFRVLQTGTLYLTGYTFHLPNGSQVVENFPDGHGLGVNNSAPPIMITAK